MPKPKGIKSSIKNKKSKEATKMASNHQEKSKNYSSTANLLSSMMLPNENIFQNAEAACISNTSDGNRHFLIEEEAQHASEVNHQGTDERTQNQYFSSGGVQHNASENQQRQENNFQIEDALEVIEQDQQKHKFPQQQYQQHAPLEENAYFPNGGNNQMSDKYFQEYEAQQAQYCFDCGNVKRHSPAFMIAHRGCICDLFVKRIGCCKNGVFALFQSIPHLIKFAPQIICWTEYYERARNGSGIICIPWNVHVDIVNFNTNIRNELLNRLLQTNYMLPVKIIQHDQ